MKIRGKHNKIALYCDYTEKAFPKSVSMKWDKGIKAWSLPYSIISYQTLKKALANTHYDYDICNDLQEHFENKCHQLQVFAHENVYKTKPYEHQELITNLILSKDKCFVFADVGTGKSKAVIDAVTQLYTQDKINKVLCICPASIMCNFANEIKIHSDLDYTIIYGSLSDRKDLISNSNTVIDILNYEMVGKLEKEIKSKKYDMLILDEVHYCKNRTSLRAKSLYKASRNIPRVIGMSGTIISNNYNDIFMPYKIVDESIFGPYFTKFKDRYFLMGGYMQYEVIGYQFEDEIKQLISTNSIKFNIRDVIKNLPPEKIIIKNIWLDTKSKKCYKELKNSMIIEQETGDIVASNVLERTLRLSQITSGLLVNKEEETTTVIGNEKLEMLKSLLLDITEKTVIFCRFTASIDRVSKLCDDLGLSYYVYDGRTKQKDLYLKFNEDDTKIWIAQIQKSEGYSLPNARYCIFYELDYSRKNHIQSKGRILRASGSPHDSIFYVYLVAENTIDEVIYETLKEKDFNSKKALEFVKGME